MYINLTNVKSQHKFKLLLANFIICEVIYMDGKNVATRFLHMLIDKKSSKADFAKFSGLSSAALTNWIKRETLPSCETILAIADYFDVSTDYVLCRTDKKKPESFSLSDEEIEIIKNYRKADEIDKRIIQNTLRIEKNTDSASSQGA